MNIIENCKYRLKKLRMQWAIPWGYSCIISTVGGKILWELLGVFMDECKLLPSSVPGIKRLNCSTVYLIFFMQNNVRNYFSFRQH